MDGDSESAHAYGKFLEELLNRHRPSPSSRRVAQEGLFKAHSTCLTDADKEHNAFVASLSPEQRALLARMLQEERNSAINGAHLAALSWIGLAQEDLKYKEHPLFPPPTEEERDRMDRWTRSPSPNSGSDRLAKEIEDLLSGDAGSGVG